MSKARSTRPTQLRHLFTSLITTTMTNNLAPFPNDGYPTETSELQADTEAELLCHLPNDALPELNKRAHVQYVARALTQGFPPRYTSQDASQPWLLNWSLQSLAVLGVAIDNTMKQRCVYPSPIHGSRSYLSSQSDRYNYGVAASRWRFRRRSWSSRTSAAHLCCNMCSRSSGQTRTRRRMGPGRQVRRGAARNLESSSHMISQAEDVFILHVS